MIVTKTGTARLLLAGLALAFVPEYSRATTLADSSDFADLSLEDLANLQISSVSKKSESLASAAASIFVITAEDIRRTSATTLPEALRLAPNLQVARTDASTWSISARGFNASTANKLLVLIDGRPVYTPLHSGVFWDAQDLFMPDIERIEVISGPNATTWGSNAVNGVINVVTRNAQQTTGTLVALGAGDEEQAHGVRFGDGTENDVHYRIYGKYFSADATEDESGNTRDDKFQRAQMGFRMDAGGDSDGFTLQGNFYKGELDETSSEDSEITGMNLLARWRRSLEDGASIRLRGYYDRSGRELVNVFEEDIDIFGAEFNHQFQPAQDHVLVWGVDARHARDDITNSDALAFLPARKNLTWISLFAQDEMQIRQDLSLMLGARVEDNDYTGVEFMPDVRLAWTPVAQHTFWSAISRAVRTPSRIDREFFIPGQPPFLLAGGAGFESEVANVIELGYRAQPADNVSWSLTAFHHDYDRLRSLEVDSSGVQTLANLLRGTSTGLEGWLSYRPLPEWRLSGGFFVLDKDLELRPDSTASRITEGNDPDHQWQLRSSWDMTDRSELEIFVRHVDELPEPEVPAYTAIDARLAWRLPNDFEISLKLQNLLDDEHAEFDDVDDRGEFGRQVFLQLQWSHP